MITSWRAQLGPEAVLYQHKGHVLVSKIADIFELIDTIITTRYQQIQLQRSLCYWPVHQITPTLMNKYMEEPSSGSFLGLPLLLQAPPTIHE